jgi:hypothetical protein
MRTKPSHVLFLHIHAAMAAGVGEGVAVGINVRELRARTELCAPPGVMHEEAVPVIRNCVIERNAWPNAPCNCLRRNTISSTASPAAASSSRIWIALSRATISALLVAPSASTGRPWASTCNTTSFAISSPSRAGAPRSPEMRHTGNYLWWRRDCCLCLNDRSFYQSSRCGRWLSRHDVLPRSKNYQSVSRSPNIVRHSDYSSWWDAFSTCMSWPANAIISVVGNVFMAFGTLAAGIYALLGVTVPAWALAPGVAGAFLFLGATAFCTGYANAWLWYDLT